MVKKFELYEQYLEQGRGLQAARKRYEEKVKESEQALAEARVKLDEVVHAELSSGADKIKEKTAARKAIEQAEKDIEHTKEEQAAAFKYFSGPGGSITRPQIVQAYNREYAPAVKAEHFPGIQARMKQGADLMLSALYDFHQLKMEYHDISRDIKDINDAAVKMREQDVSYYAPNPFERLEDSGLNLPKLAKQLNDITKGYKMPADANYIKEVK